MLVKGPKAKVVIQRSHGKHEPNAKRFLFSSLHFVCFSKTQVTVIDSVTVSHLSHVVAAAFSSLARILGECSTSHSSTLIPHAHTNSTLYARISPQWLSELKRLWLGVP